MLLCSLLVSVVRAASIDQSTNTDLIALAAYLVVIVVVCYFFPLKGTQARGEVHLIKFTPNFVSTFPVQVFAFTCAQNVDIYFLQQRVL